MTSEASIVFYDIASNAPLRTFAPNPWKTRFALNFKKLHYRTEWVDLPNIRALREKLGVPANRTLPDGTPFHTLPLIQNTQTGKFIGDSFEIALYLDKAYPDSPKLFRPLTTGLTAAFNAQVDGIFTKYVGIASEQPFDPRCAEAIGAIFAKRAAAMGFKDLAFTDEYRETLFVGLEAALGELAKAYRHTGGTTDYVWRAGGSDTTQAQQPPPGREEGGVFLDGTEPVYSDFIVGAWLKMLEESLPAKEWQRVRAWQGGMWGRLVDALSEWTEIK